MLTVSFWVLLYHILKHSATVVVNGASYSSFLSSSLKWTIRRWVARRCRKLLLHFCQKTSKYFLLELPWAQVEILTYSLQLLVSSSSPSSSSAAAVYSPVSTVKHIICKKRNKSYKIWQAKHNKAGCQRQTHMDQRIRHHNTTRKVRSATFCTVCVVYFCSQIRQPLFCMIMMSEFYIQLAP